VVDIDTGYTPETWKFDEEVTRVFDDMLGRSIPNYEGMRDITNRLISQVIMEHGGGEPCVIVDIGSSRGETIDRILKRNCPTFIPEPKDMALEVYGLEISPPMIAASQRRFDEGGWTNVQILSHDLREGLQRAEIPFDSATIITSILTLMFVPTEHRPRLLTHIYETLHGAGTFFLVEKITGAHLLSDERFVSAYYEMKSDHGYTEDDIQRKRLSLEGVLAPLSATANEQMLRDAGFRFVETIWAWGNFRGWMATK
jgi:tRNA (cmo5U34)-methyltransferase